MLKYLDKDTLAQMASECRDLAGFATALGISKDAARGRARRAGLKLSDLFAFERLRNTPPPTTTQPRMIVVGNCKPRPGKEVYRVIVTPDAQVPYHDDVSMKLVEKYVSHHYFDEWVDLGDFLDLDQISSFNKGKLRLLEGRNIADDYAIGNKILDRRIAALKKHNPRAVYTALEGNHDYRIERLIDEQPQLKGLVEVPVGLKFEERGIEFVRCYSEGQTYRLGEAFFHHGLYVGGNHAKKMVESFGVNIFYGHVHDVSQHSKTSWGRDATVVGQSLGCLCIPDLQYMKGNPHNWAQAFATFSFFPDGTFTYHVTRVVNHRFVSPEGGVYCG
jgi:hypothetical protein